MFGTIIWRLREAIDVFFGKKKTVALQSSTQPIESKRTLSPEKFLEQNKELAELINATSIEFCFSEFGETRTNAGGNHFAGNRLDPSLSTLRKFFPNAKYTVYSDFDLKIEQKIKSLFSNLLSVESNLNIISKGSGKLFSINAIISFFHQAKPKLFC